MSSFSRFGEVRHHEKVSGREVDLYMPKRNLVVEYDGEHWHKNKTESDVEKSMHLLKGGFSVLRLRESPLHMLGLSHPQFREYSFSWSRVQEEVNESVDSALIDFLQ